MIKLFSRYLTIGVVNTIIHWIVFGVLLYVFHASQALSNLGAFCVAVTFSFFANAKYTFKARATSGRYLLYLGFMGALSAATGWLADYCGLPALFTLIAFSAISLICGFFYSKFIVFRSEKA